jgi:hypothetical protein
MSNVALIFHGGSMIHFFRTAAIAPGKQMSAMAFAREISAYLKSQHGLELAVSTPIGGNPNRVGWAVTYENLAAYEASSARMMADPGYHEVLLKGSENFIAGSVHDELWRAV